MTPTPLPIPDDFDWQVMLFAKQTENGTFHESRRGAAFAEQLVANGTQADLELAEKIIDVVLRCQELDPADAHYGNFYWMVEDSVVFDLNAVEFNLERLIPMMIRHGHRLTPALRERILKAIRLGLEEIERLDVLVVYTNIALLDILNTCLGGELLNEPRIAERGYQKLVKWIAFTDQFGSPYEFNSPTYTVVDIRALNLLWELVRDQGTRVRARTAAARLGLSVGLHIHQATGRWGGPHGRAYHPSVVCDLPPEVNLVNNWITEGILPRWVEDVLVHRPKFYQVEEGVYTPSQMTTTTYHSPSFVMGTASKELSGQSNVFIAHYVRENASKPGVIYTRYLTNDKWLGDFYHATDRTKSRNLVDEGRFWGVQNENRTIGLYAIPKNLGVIHSAKAVIIWTIRSEVDEIWVGDRKINSLPVEVHNGEVVVAGSGKVYTAVLPIKNSNMGRYAPVRLSEIHGDLVLEMYNYLGEAKPFWEMGWPGAFYKGVPQCGFYLEITERSNYLSGVDFAKVVASGMVQEVSQPPFVYSGEGERLWSVSYNRGEKTIGIEVDLMEWRLKRRWTECGLLGFPMFDSPVAIQSRSGKLQVGEAILTWGYEGKENGSAWLFASPATKRWVVGYDGIIPAPMCLTLPEGKIEIDSMGMGTMEWDQGDVRIETVELSGSPRVTGGNRVIIK